MSTRGLSKIVGKVHLVGDDVNTDYIIASRYKARAENVEGLAPHVFEDLDPELASRIQAGDLLVAGDNFGSGSSRETAPRVLLAAGIRAVVARSFARIFFRNSINVGLPVIEAEWQDIDDGDEIHIDLESGRITGKAGSVAATFDPLPQFLTEILQAGGIRAQMAKARGSE